MRRALVIAIAVLVAAPAAAPAATVQTMVAGKQRVLREAAPVKLVEKRRVKVGGRRCTVAGAVLVDGRLRVRFEPDPALWMSR